MMIVQIVPSLPPSLNGLGDYGLRLAHELLRTHGIRTCFVVGDPSWRGEDTIEGFRVLTLADRNPEALLGVLRGASDNRGKEAPVLLQYVGYGYAKRGAPIWLVEGIRRWRAGQGQTNCRLAVFFHEIYAFGPPWRSSFWLSPLQREISAGLFELCDDAVTNRAGYAKLLRGLRPGILKSITVMPVISNIGECANAVPLTDREASIIVFGNKKSKELTYLKYSEHLWAACDALMVREIIDIGAPSGIRPRNIGDRSYIEAGVIPADKIGGIIDRARAGFISFPDPGYLAKSSIFASFCARGLLPIVPSSGRPAGGAQDGLLSGVHYLEAPPRRFKVSMESAERIASSAHVWYRGHDLGVHAAHYAACLADQASRGMP